MSLTTSNLQLPVAVTDVHFSSARAFEERCQQLDQFCLRLEAISGDLAKSVEHINNANFRPNIIGLPSDMPSYKLGQPRSRNETSGAHFSQDTQPNLHTSHDIGGKPGVDTNRIDEDSSETENSSDDALDERIPSSTHYGSLVADSYGKLRYVHDP